MGFIIKSGDATRFSYIEYQALMLCLASLMVMGMGVIELALNRFQVMPLLFPGMYSVRGRRFYIFDVEVTDTLLARRLHWHTKMVIRMTLFVVLSYLWTHCVMETTQIVGDDFPVNNCHRGDDCFASDLHFLTFYNRQHRAVDCKAPPEPFPAKVVISCIHLVQPSATNWLMQLAIAHSVTQLNLKSFEMLVWICGTSRTMSILIWSLGVAAFVVFISLFFSGVMTEFVTSWLSFVMGLSIPCFLYTVFSTGKVLRELWVQDAKRVQSSIERSLDAALTDFDVALPAVVSRQTSRQQPGNSEAPVSDEAELAAASPSSLRAKVGGTLGKTVSTARSLLSMTGLTTTFTPAHGTVRGDGEDSDLFSEHSARLGDHDAGGGLKSMA
mmetsp:Transcript_85532/g.184569  ORF Transcript_85532/g.184569 Transcript_85532/m.184569 type:complete len:384 (+) Transcript_85532:156-1307(+)